MVNTVLTDKTGTLTRNVMEFFKASIGGTSYGDGVTEIERANAARRAGLEPAAFAPAQPPSAEAAGAGPATEAAASATAASGAPIAATLPRCLCCARPRRCRRLFVLCAP